MARTDGGRLEFDELARIYRRLTDSADSAAYRVALRRFIENPGLVFPAWQIVRLGTYQTAAEMLAAAKADSFYSRISGKQRDCIEKMPMAGKPTEVELVKAKVRDLGFAKGATYDELFARASLLGLGKCPTEAIMQFVLQFSELVEKGVFIRVAMDDLVASDDYHSGLALCIDDYGENSSPLGTFESSIDFPFGLCDVWLFARHRS